MKKILCHCLRKNNILNIQNINAKYLILTHKKITVLNILHLIAQNQEKNT